MQAYRDKLFSILDHIEKDLKYFPKQVKAGAIANALSSLFTNIDEGNRYGRSYRYLRQLERPMQRRGWVFIEINGQKHLSLECPAIRFRDYIFCNDCDKRIDCLTKPLPF